MCSDLLGIGQFHASHNPMIQWKVGGFKIAGVAPAIPDDTADFAVDLIIPKIEAAYKFKGDAFFLDIAGGFQAYTLDYFAEGSNDPDVLSYLEAGVENIPDCRRRATIGGGFGEDAILTLNEAD